MWRKLGAAGLILAALMPAAHLAWTWRAMPHLGFYHDDSLYWVCAKSLAGGHGYRIISLPGQPLQTKYPPLFPALLALVWKLSPGFPANLPWATLLAWLFYPLCIGLTWLLLRRLGFSSGERLALTVVAALNPVIVLFSFALMPELLFLCLFATVILLTRKHPVLAGLTAGLAFLAKSAAIPLLVSVPIAYLLRRRFRAAAGFFLAMLPAVSAWEFWVWRHISLSRDLVTLYYTNYVGFQRYNVSLRDVPLVVWHNLDSFLVGIGRMLTFDTEIWEARHIERLVAVVAIAGIVRLARRAGELQYPLAALAFSGMLLIWHTPPDQRFVLPLYPLLLAGLATELHSIYGAVRSAWRKDTVSDRAAACFAAVVLSAFVVFASAGALVGDFAFLPELLQSYRAGLRGRLPAYRWLAARASPNANVFAYDDPLVFLYTGRHACGLPIPPKLLYHDDQAGIARLLDDLPAFARRHRISYILLTPLDFYRDLHAGGARRLARCVASNSVFQKVYGSPDATVYRVIE